MNNEYRQDQLPSDIFNAGNGDIKNYNGQAVRVLNTGSGTRRLESLGDWNLYQAEQNTKNMPNVAVQTAQKLLDFQKKANEPIVAGIQGAQGKLKDTYDKLLASIKGQQQVSENQQTLATNNELARRGLSTSSGLGEQTMASSLLPVQAAYASALSGAEQNYTANDIDLALKLAGAKAGSPLEAISGGIGLANSQLNANNDLTALAIQQYNRQNLSAYEKAQLEAANKGDGGNQYATLSEGQTLFDLLGGNPVYTAPKTYKSSGSSGSGSSNYTQYYGYNGGGVWG